MAQFHGRIPASDQQMLAGIFSGVDVDFEVDTDEEVLNINRGGSPVMVKLDLEGGPIPSPEELPTPDDEEEEEDDLPE